MPASDEERARFNAAAEAARYLQCHAINVPGLHGLVNIQFFGKSMTVLGGCASAIEETGRRTIAEVLQSVYDMARAHRASLEPTPERASALAGAIAAALFTDGQGRRADRLVFDYGSGGEMRGQTGWSESCAIQAIATAALRHLAGQGSLGAVGTIDHG